MCFAAGVLAACTSRLVPSTRTANPPTPWAPPLHPPPHTTTEEEEGQQQEGQEPHKGLPQVGQLVQFFQPFLGKRDRKQLPSASTLPLMPGLSTQSGGEELFDLWSGVTCSCDCWLNDLFSCEIKENGRKIVLVTLSEQFPRPSTGSLGSGHPWYRCPSPRCSQGTLKLHVKPGRLPQGPISGPQRNCCEVILQKSWLAGASA